MTYQLFWGDLHSHCSISYGEGTVEQALLRAQAAARLLLDHRPRLLAGHADRSPAVRRDHRLSPRRLRAAGRQLASELIAKQAAASRDGEFIALSQLRMAFAEIWRSQRLRSGAGIGTARRARSAGAAYDWLATPAPSSFRITSATRPAIAGSTGGTLKTAARRLSRSFRCTVVRKAKTLPIPMLHDMGPRDWRQYGGSGLGAGAPLRRDRFDRSSRRLSRQPRRRTHRRLCRMRSRARRFGKRSWSAACTR